MSLAIFTDRKYLSEEKADSLYRKHVRGAWARSGASFLIWIVFLVYAWLVDSVTASYFKGITLAVFVLVAINPPTLWLLKKIRNRNIYEITSLFINIVDVICYSAVFYFFGGIRTGYLALCYAGGISYVGVAAPKRVSITVTVLSILAYNTVINLEHFGILPHQNPRFSYNYGTLDILICGILGVGLMAIVSYMSTSAGTALRKNRNNLRIRNRELDLINKISKIANQSLDLEKVLDSICQALPMLYPVRFVAIALTDEKHEKLEVIAFHSNEPGLPNLLGYEMEWEGTRNLQEIFEHIEPFTPQSTSFFPTKSHLENVFKHYGIESIVLAPLHSRGKLIGTIIASPIEDELVFTDRDRELAQTVLTQVSSAINNAQIHAKTESALGTAERDLEIGRQIQSGFFPRVKPRVSGWEITPYFAAAKQVSGDFYDYFPIGKNGRMGLVLADICDKGVGAALFMVLFRSLIRAFGEDRQHTEDNEELLLSIVSNINSYVATIHDHSNMFATVFLAVLEPKSNTVFYVNAGHELPLLLDGEGKIKKILEPTGPAVGLMPNLSFSVESVEMQRGDILLVYTDGAVNARNKRGEEISEEVFLAHCQRPYPSAFSLIKHIEIQISSFVKNADQFDDITMLALRRKLTAYDEIHEMTQVAKMENLNALKDFIEEASALMELSEDMIFAFKLAAEEACTNIITHGYKDATPGPIRMTFEKHPEYVKLTIYDEGTSFDPQEAVEPDVESDWDEREPGGLGLYIVRQMIDKVEYESREGQGNFLTLVKAMNPQ